MNNYKNYKVGDTIAFNWGYSSQKGIVEAANDDIISVVLDEDKYPYSKGHRFLFKYNDSSYKESIKLKSAPILVPEEAIKKETKEVKIPWYKKLFNIYG